jgi:hypothetical protein
VQRGKIGRVDEVRKSSGNVKKVALIQDELIEGRVWLRSLDLFLFRVKRIRWSVRRFVGLDFPHPVTD